MADPLILHEHDPSLAAGAYGLVSRNAGHLRELPQTQPSGTEKIRDLPAAKAAIKEQLWQVVRVPSRDAYRVLQMVVWDAVLVGYHV